MLLPAEHGPDSPPTIVQTDDPTSADLALACAVTRPPLLFLQVEKRLELVKQVSHSTHKKLTACLQGQQGAEADKRSVSAFLPPAPRQLHPWRTVDPLPGPCLVWLCLISLAISVSVS